MQNHQDFFEKYIGEKSLYFSALPQSGSARINYIGKSKDKTFVITYNKNQRENEAFYYFSNLFESLNLNTPKVLKINNDQDLYIQEFLGEKTLSEIISDESESPRVKKLVKQSLEQLYRLQTKTLGKIDYSKSFEYEAYNRLPITHDLYYFKNFLVDVLEIEYHKSTLLKEFEKITAIVEQLAPKTIMIRDFQSRNIMVNDQDNVYFIDYQSAMQGPATYDVVSFLYQAKANFSNDFKIEMQNYYIQLWPENQRQELTNSITWMKLMRFLQVLGAYGFRGLIQRKKHFINSLNQGIENLTNLSNEWPIIVKQFPELKAIITQLKNEEIQLKISELSH